MTRSIDHALAPAAQLDEEVVVAEHGRRRVLLDRFEPRVAWGWGPRAGRFGIIEVNGGIEQAAETEVFRRVSRDDRSAAVASASAIHSIGDVRAHSTRYYRKGAIKGTGGKI